jgi:hypothetical protein
MSVQDIKLAITQLSSTELAELAAWFEEFQAETWDKQIEKDVEAGRFDQLIQQAEAEFEVEWSAERLKRPITSPGSSTESFPFLPQ